MNLEYLTDQDLETILLTIGAILVVMWMLKTIFARDPSVLSLSHKVDILLVSICIAIVIITVQYKPYLQRIIYIYLALSVYFGFAWYIHPEPPPLPPTKQKE